MPRINLGKVVPQKGTDYYTEAEKTEIETEVKQAVETDLENENIVKDGNYVHTDNNYTTQEKQKLAGLSNYDDTEVKQSISNLNTNKADRIEIPGAISNLTEDSTHRTVTDTEKTSWNNKSNFSGNYNDLSNKPTIPSEVTESTVSNWGFTKNTGTITGITMNGVSKGTSEVVDLGTVITQHQDISGKFDTTKVKNANSTTAGDVYDVRYINSMIGNIESLLQGV